MSGPHICVLVMEKSMREAINAMRPKHIFNSILAVLFLFPLMGTSFNGINDEGLICGRYVDVSGIARGFLARAKGTPSGNQAESETKANVSPSPVTPLIPSSSAWGGATSAR